MTIRLLVLSATASASNYIQSFAGDPSVELHVTDTDAFCPGLYAAGVTPHWMPPARQTENYRSALARILADNRIDALIPTSDYDVEAVTAWLQDGWSPAVALFRPSFASFESLNDTAKLAAILDRELPHTRPVTARADEDIGKVPFPLVLKPLNQSGGKGVSFVDAPGDLDAARATIEATYGDNYVVQQFIPGRTYVSTLIYDNEGRLVVGVAMRSTVTFFTWGGGGCAGEMVDEPGLIDLAAQVVEACGGWRGPVNLEWRRHPESGQFYLMEANCRLNGYSYLTTMNGFCLPKVALATLLGQPAPEMRAVTPSRNFVIGYREMPVTEWVVAAT